MIAGCKFQLYLSTFFCTHIFLHRFTNISCLFLHQCKSKAIPLNRLHRTGSSISFFQNKAQHHRRQHHLPVIPLHLYILPRAYLPAQHLLQQRRQRINPSAPTSIQQKSQRTEQSAPTSIQQKNQPVSLSAPILIQLNCQRINL